MKKTVKIIAAAMAAIMGTVSVSQIGTSAVLLDSPTNAEKVFSESDDTELKNSRTDIFYSLTEYMKENDMEFMTRDEIVSWSKTDNSVRNKFIKTFGKNAYRILGFTQHGLIGDTNEDGETDIFDAAAVARYTVRKTVAEDWKINCMDVDRNGTVDIFDAVTIAKKTVEKVPDDEFKPESDFKIPQSKDEAMEFLNKYGKTHIEDGIICMVFPEQGSKEIYSYDIIDNGSTYDYKAHTVCREVYEDEAFGSQYEVIACEISGTGTIDINLVRYSKYSSETTETVEENLTFELSGDTAVETDIYSIVPDSITEYREIVAVNERGNVVSSDDYIMFCGESCSDGGYSLFMNKSGSGDVEEVYNGVICVYHSERIDGGMEFNVILYKPVSDGIVNMEWVQARSWDYDETVEPLVNAEFKISEGVVYLSK